jgi:hypothetical protein
MTDTIPELTTLGALLRFAVAQEADVAVRYTGWEAAPEAPASFAGLGQEHHSRAEKLTRLLREQLNEMILEPISGLRAGRYLPTPTEDPLTDAPAAEQALAQLYTDIASHAGHLLPGATRTLSRFAERSRYLAEGL